MSRRVRTNFLGLARWVVAVATLLGLSAPGASAQGAEREEAYALEGVTHRLAVVEAQLYLADEERMARDFQRWTRLAEDGTEHQMGTLIVLSPDRAVFIHLDYGSPAAIPVMINVLSGTRDSPCTSFLTYSVLQTAEPISDPPRYNLSQALPAETHVETTAEPCQRPW